MTEVARYKGSQLAQNGFPLVNMIASDAQGLEFLSGEDDMPRMAEATITHYPVESDDILWSGVEADLEMQNIGDATPAQLLLSLYGITCHGDINLLGEKVFNSIPTTLTNETVNFDLLKSACEASLTVDNNQAAVGKIQLNLPYRTNYYESLLMNYGIYSGWKRYNIFPITGNTTTTTYIPVWITLDYDSDMNSDFSDIRFMDWNGNLLNYGIVSKTNGSTATFAVQLLTTPTNGVTENLKIWYKNANATSTALPLNQIYNLWDDFEDGKYTGRSTPYQNWWTVVGSSALSINPVISGAYSIKHVGAGAGQVLYPGLLTSQSLTSYTLRLNFKLTNQGSAANTPYANLFYLRYVDANNFLRVDTYWNGSAQKIRLYRMQGGSGTTISEATLAASKLDTTTVYGFIIRDSGSHFTVSNMYSGTVYINVDYSCTVGTTQKGLGCNQDTAAIWDNIRMYPYIATDPTVGTIWGEAQGTYGGTWTWLSILSDNLVAEATNATFTTPTMDVNTPAYITTNEYDRYANYDSPKVIINDKSVLNLGYHGLDCYDALRLRIQSNCNADYAYNIPEVRFKYEI